jgi:hypothetical protein
MTVCFLPGPYIINVKYLALEPINLLSLEVQREE